MVTASDYMDSYDDVCSLFWLQDGMLSFCETKAAWTYTSVSSQWMLEDIVPTVHASHYTTSPWPAPDKLVLSTLPSQASSISPSFLS